MRLLSLMTMIDSIGRIYLDYAASTPVRDEVREAMLPYLGAKFGNPSSIHSFGRELRRTIDECRDRIKFALNCSYREIIFLSGATEGDNWAIKNLADANKSKGHHFIISAFEHHAVMESAEYLEKKGYECTRVKPGSDGVVRIEDFESAIRKDTTFISLMAVNNELGTVQPVRDVAILAKERGLMMHTDCAQAISTQPVNLEEIPVDILTVTAHKIYGPIGCGFNFIRKGTGIDPLIHGGSHEFHLRAGTENVAGIVGLARAVELAVKEREERVLAYKELGKYMFDLFNKNALNVTLVGSLEKRAPHIYNIRVHGVPSENLLIGFDEAGIAVSTGSACASGSAEPSHVMKALGFDFQKAMECIRVSFGIHTKKEHVDKFVRVLKEIISINGEHHESD